MFLSAVLDHVQCNTQRVLDISLVGDRDIILRGLTDLNEEA